MIASRGETARCGIHTSEVAAIRRARRARRMCLVRFCTQLAGIEVVVTAPAEPGTAASGWRLLRWARGDRRHRRRGAARQRSLAAGFWTFVTQSPPEPLSVSPTVRKAPGTCPDMTIIVSDGKMPVA